MTPVGPLARRIAAANPQPKPKPVPPWLERLTARDMTKTAH